MQNLYSFRVHFKLIMCVQLSFSRGINYWTRDLHGGCIKSNIKHKLGIVNVIYAT